MFLWSLWIVTGLHQAGAYSWKSVQRVITMRDEPRPDRTEGIVIIIQTEQSITVRLDASPRLVDEIDEG